ncbi:MAG: hypothetical protein ABIN80_28690 [Dyadobacter sp.]|uniref:hypothetical protein n=1 Tax=Dyadobacter sp. TaxID=1914288 RepID=UPI0032678EA7
MKAKQIIFFIVLYMVYRYSQNRAAATPATGTIAAPPLPILSNEAAILRRDFTERYDLLLARLEYLETSPYA